MMEIRGRLLDLDEIEARGLEVGPLYFEAENGVLHAMHGAKVTHFEMHGSGIKPLEMKVTFRPKRESE